MPLFCLISYGLINRFVVTSVVVQGRSMLPTLEHGKRYLLHRWLVHQRRPHRGDLVVIRDPGHDDFAVKRVVALAGETVEIKNGAVFVDGMLLFENYLLSGTKTLPAQADGRTWTLASDQYFVLGDNRGLSEDSRAYGPVDHERIVGFILN
jgi:signal peptidase I